VAVGTAALLDYLSSVSEYDSTLFSFCMGADAFLDLMDGKWKESARVLEMLGGGRRLVVLYRSTADDVDASTTDNNYCNSLLERRVKEAGAQLVRIGHLGSISSSQVRACTDVEQLSTMVVPEVLQYMRDNHLYQFAARDDD